MRLGAVLSCSCRCSLDFSPHPSSGSSLAWLSSSLLAWKVLLFGESRGRKKKKNLHPGEITIISLQAAIIYFFRGCWKVCFFLLFVARKRQGSSPTCLSKDLPTVDNPNSCP